MGLLQLLVFCVETISLSLSMTKHELLFVDDTEKDIAANKTRGITGPGWWAYHTHTDVSGSTRHKAECLAFVHASASDAGDETLMMTQSQQMQRTPSPSAPTTPTRLLLVVQQPSSLQRLLPTLVQHPSNGRRDCTSSWSIL